MKSIFNLASILIVASMLLTACGTPQTAPSADVNAGTSSTVDGNTPVVFADENLELLYQAAIGNNPQWVGTDLQKRQMFFFQYGGEEAKEVFARAYAEENDLTFVKASAITALKNPPAWLYALGVVAGTEVIVSMNAQEAANLQLPIIPLEQIGTDVKMIVMTAEFLAAEVAAQYLAQTGPMLTSLAIADNLIPANKVVNGAYAYYDAMPDGRCFFGIQSSFGWSANILDDPCPNGPDDDEAISKLIEKLWNSFTSGFTWGELIGFGGSSAAHVAAFIEVAKAYGISLIP